MTAPPVDPPTPPADTPPADPPKPVDPNPDPPADPPKDTTDWKAQARKHEDRAKEHKTAADKAAADLRAVLDAIATATGQKPADADPVKLAAELGKARDTARSTQVELAVHRTASKHGADADSLLDSRAFLKAVAELDPTASDFASKVEAAIKTAVKDNPKLKAGPAAAAQSGGDFAGGTGAGGPITEAQLAKMTPAEVAKAYADGKLKHLM